MKTKDFLPAICIIVCSLLPNARSFSQTWLWAKSSGGTSYDEGWSVSADASGNAFITGYFTSPTVTFGATTLTNAGGSSPCDVFIAKYDAGGNMLWANRAGGTGMDAGYSVSADANGNAFVTGYFMSSTITFGATTLISAGGLGDVFIAKYDANGNLVWAQHAGGTGQDFGYSVSASGGNAFITGFFTSPTITFGATTLTNANGGFYPPDIFIAKYDAGGNVVWAQRAGGTGQDVGYSVSADATGNVFVTGTFTSPTINFGATLLATAGNTDVFIAKYDSGGNVLWAQRAGGANADKANSVSADPGGNVFVSGEFNSPTITFGSSILPNGGGGSPDVFIAKYDATGNVLWAQRAGGASADGSYSVSADAGGNVYETGYFKSAAITFGSVTLTPPLANCAGSGFGCDPMFIIKYDANGKVLCTSALASGGEDNIGVSADPFGNAFVIADFVAHPFIVGSDTLPLTGGAGAENIFVAKYTCCNNVTPIITASNITIQQGQNATLIASGGGTYLWSNGLTDAIIVVSPTVNTIYCVIVTDPNYCSDTTCVTVTLEPIDCSGKLYFPNAFSPNGDGENDVLKIYFGNINCIKNFELHIYNRWGEKVFETTDPGFLWDGTYKGTKENTSVLDYYMKATLNSGKDISMTGNISIVR